MMTTTIMSSISVKPFCVRIMCVLLDGVAAWRVAPHLPCWIRRARATAGPQPRKDASPVELNELSAAAHANVSEIAQHTAMRPARFRKLAAQAARGIDGIRVLQAPS
jgi:hypothetical protein